MTTLHFLHMPIQLLKPSVRDFTFDRLHLSYHKCRSVLQHYTTVDRSVFKTALLPQSDAQHRHNIIHSVSTLSAVDQAALQRFHKHESNICIFCHKCVSSPHHIYWECDHPKLAEARGQSEHPMEECLIQYHSHLPLQLLYGIPPKMQIQPGSVFWDNDTLDALQDNGVHSDFQRFIGIDPEHDHMSHITQWLKPVQDLDAHGCGRSTT